MTRTMPEHADSDLDPAVEAVDLTKDYGDLVTLEPTRPRRARPAVGRADRPQRVGQVDVPAVAHRAARARPPARSTVAGWPAGSAEARATTSFLPDEPVLYDDLSVREHARVRLHACTAVRGWDDYSEELVERLGARRSGRRPRLAIQSWPATEDRHHPRRCADPFSLMLVDEPFVGLDQGGKTAMLELFEEAHEDGAATVVATHEPAYVEQVDRCIALRDGEVVFDGKAEVSDVLTLVTA